MSKLLVEIRRQANIGTLTEIAPGDGAIIAGDGEPLTLRLTLPVGEEIRLTYLGPNPDKQEVMALRHRDLRLSRVLAYIRERFLLPMEIEQEVSTLLYQTGEFDESDL